MTFREFKRLLRSKSWEFVKNSRPGEKSKKMATYNWKGHTINYRTYVQDTEPIYEVLISRSRHPGAHRFIRIGGKNEYWVPKEVEPKVIMDIGGNIGCTSVYFSHMFPDAKIYTFEPVPTNFEMLKMNLESKKNASFFNVGLGSEDGTMDIYSCDNNQNVGGFSLYGLEVDDSKSQKVEIRNTSNFMSESGITNVDLIKIDTEGAEYDILTSMDKNILTNVKWILGELHGHKDYELLAYLSEWFDIDIQKSLGKRLSIFNARNKKFANDIPWKH
ncbi:MAG: FkbM family methyltransferase [Desulfobacterales bacterium]|nr:FkbM family methyltransferase [Desulfobacterales bacterium]